MNEYHGGKVEHTQSKRLVASLFPVGLIMWPQGKQNCGIFFRMQAKSSRILSTSETQAFRDMTSWEQRK